MHVFLYVCAYISIYIYIYIICDSVCIYAYTSFLSHSVRAHANDNATYPRCGLYMLP